MQSENLRKYSSDFIAKLLPPFLRREKRIAFLAVALSPLMNRMLKKTLDTFQRIEDNFGFIPTEGEIKRHILKKFRPYVNTVGEVTNENGEIELVDSVGIFNLSSGHKEYMVSKEPVHNYHVYNEEKYKEEQRQPSFFIFNQDNYNTNYNHNDIILYNEPFKMPYNTFVQIVITEEAQRDGSIEGEIREEMQKKMIAGKVLSVDIKTVSEIEAERNNSI